jgi:hypothetical protein
MLRSSILLIFLFSVGHSFGQFHEMNIRKISDLAEAESYASRYGEVSFGIVNAELDVLLFDSVDLSNMRASVGKVNTLYQRRTKFLKDTVVTMMNLQVISFEMEHLSSDSTDLLIERIIADHQQGMSYWNLMKKYESGGCHFSSGPIQTDHLVPRYGINLVDRKKSELIQWRYPNQPNLPVLIIIDEEAHPVPAFYAISYNVAG